MPTPDSEHLQQQLAAEMALARAGSDEGLLPAYSLLGELADALAGDDVHSAAAIALRDQIEALFEADGLWTEDLLGKVQAFLNGETVTPATSSEASGPKDKPLEPPGNETVPASVDALLVLDLGENRDLLEEFVNEATEHLDQIEEALLKVEHNPTAKDSVHSLFRSFHTIKGVSGFLQLDPINALSHQVESLLDLAREDQLILDSDIVSLLLQARDLLVLFIRQIQHGLAEDQQPTEVIPVSHIIAAVRARAATPKAKAQTAVQPAAAQPEAASAAPLQEVSVVQPPDMVKAIAEGTVAAMTAGGSEGGDSTIRVRTDKLDSLVDSVGELVILEAQLINAIGEAAENSALQKHLNQLRRIIRGIQDSAMSIRMVPVRSTFRKMERLARELGRGLSKQVNLVLSGEETELDRTMVEVIADPLVHMIRNSVDHGLESPEERRAAGKPEQGTLSLSAYHQGGYITLRLEDDGRGLNTARIREKAIARNLIQPHQNLSEAEIHHLIFQPGFSTAEMVSGISGRGVGMDVVRRNIESLRGKIEIESVAGKGSVFTIKLPLTLAIIDGLVVKAGGDVYILPATSVRVAIQADPRHLNRIHGKGETLTLRDEIIPLHYLHRLFDIKSSVQRASDGIVVVIDSFNRTYGLVVDELISKQEVVIKSLGPITRDLPGLLGGAILGDGSIALILDPTSLVTTSSEKATAEKASA